MDHPRSVKPPPQNVQQCYAHVDIEEGEGAPSAGTDTSSRRAEKHPITPEHLKKRPGSSETMGNPTSKCRWIIQDWSDEDKEKTRPLICSTLVRGRV
jgi:hypothetical protein